MSRHNLHNLAACIVGMLMLVSACSADQSPTPVDNAIMTSLNLSAAVGSEAPDLAFYTLENEELQRLSDFRGRTVLLNLWATWCAPCLEEIPALNQLQKQYDDQGLVVILLSDEKPEVLQTFFSNRERVGVIGFLDSKRLKNPFQTIIRPVTFIIDADGVIRSGIVGKGSYEAFENRIIMTINSDVNNIPCNFEGNCR